MSRAAKKVGTAGTGGRGRQSDLRGSVYFLQYSYTFLRGNLRFILVAVRRSKIYFAALCVSGIVSRCVSGSVSG